MSLAWVWNHVDVRGEWDCWPTINTSGTLCGRTCYGQVDHGSGKVGIHRLIAAITHGPFPADAYVCHHCDEKSCANPRHLYIGDAASNVRDMYSRSHRYRHTGDKIKPGTL